MHVIHDDKEDTEETLVTQMDTDDSKNSMETKLKRQTSNQSSDPMSPLHDPKTKNKRFNANITSFTSKSLFTINSKNAQQNSNVNGSSTLHLKNNDHHSPSIPTAGNETSGSKSFLPHEDKSGKTAISQYDISTPRTLQDLSSKHQSPKKLDAIKIAKSLIRKFPVNDTFTEIKQLSSNKICLIIKYRAITNNIIALRQWKQQEI